jgi:uncharacterized protein YndB with AHSA1/START domain
MPTVSTTITINRPVEQVFNYLIDPANHKDWNESIVEVGLTPAGSVAVGSIYVYKTSTMGMKFETHMQVSAFEQNRVWAFTTIGVPTPVTTTYQFEPAGDQTQMTITMELTGGYPAAAEPMIIQSTQTSLNQQANMIKQKVGG